MLQTTPESTLLGQDFLTWLWFRVDKKNSNFALNDGKNFTVAIEQRISVLGGGTHGQESASVNSPKGELTEAKTGLITGKKVQKAQFRFTLDSDEWLVNIKADDFTLNGIKTPKIEQKSDPQDEPDATLLEKYSLLEQIYTLFDAVYNTFLTIRTTKKWDAEVEEIRAWLQEK